jgi:hypothetical protein
LADVMCGEVFAANRRRAGSRRSNTQSDSSVTPAILTRPDRIVLVEPREEPHLDIVERRHGREMIEDIAPK